MALYINSKITELNVFTLHISYYIINLFTDAQYSLHCHWTSLTCGTELKLLVKFRTQLSILSILVLSQASSCSGSAGSKRHCLLCFLLCTRQHFFNSVLLHSLSSGNGARFLFTRLGTTQSVAKLFNSLHLNMSTSLVGITGKASFTIILLQMKPRIEICY